MSFRSTVEATLKDKVLFVLGVATILFEAVYASLRYLLAPASRSQPSLRREITRVVMHALHDLDRFNIAQLQWALPSSSVAYNYWIATMAAAENIPSEAFTEPIGHEGASLYWIGNKDAKKVILYYHGGGYVLPLSILHLNFNNHIRREVKRQSGINVKLAFLVYSLLPKDTYPTQFRQAALALQHVLDSGISPADIMISGDSVGGQLALQVLSHVLHPHPSLRSIQPLAVPLAGLLVISPWVIYDSNAPTFTSKDKDILTPNTIFKLARAIRPGIEKRTPEGEGFWSEPLVAPPEWWRPTAQALRNVLVVYGSQELFTEDNAALVEKMRLGTAGTSVDVRGVEEPCGLHIGPVLDATLGQEPSETSKIIAQWANKCFASKSGGFFTAP